MNIELPEKRSTGRPVEHPDSALHEYWRQASRRHYYKKKAEKKEKEEEMR